MQFIKVKPTYASVLLINLIALTSFFATAYALECLQCKSETDSNCLKSTYEKTLCKGGETECYISNANGLITRGCYKDKPCEPGANCITCDADGCNNQNICKTCETSDTECSQSNVSDAKYNAICPKSDTKCFVNINDKKVERRCSKDTDKCADTDSSTCKQCPDAICNTGIFPESRKQCFQCTGSSCNAAGSDTNNAKPCVNFVTDEKCYVTGESAEAMVRGCMSDTKPCESSDKSCYTCSENNCNNASYKRDATLSCIKCQGSTCAEAQTADKAAACKNQLLYNQIETCFIHTNGSEVKRGCLYDETDVQCDNEDSCHRCTTKDCNNAKQDTTFTCIVCRSDENEDCWNNADKVDGRSCRTGESSPDDGCFHGIWHGIAIRGCYIDAAEPMQATCKDDKNKQCILCHKKDCNTGKSSAASTTLSFSLLAIVITIFWNSK